MNTNNKGKPNGTASLLKHVGLLRDFSSGLLRLATLAPDRLTASQLTFFMLAGISDLAGAPTTFTEIKEVVGDPMSKSLHTTYKVFLSDEGRSSTRQQALGWLMRETDRHDNRKKYLRLTKKGRDVMAQVITEITGEEP